MLFCITFNSQAQLLWKISGKDLVQPSYIFGTHHLAPISIVDSIAGLKAAMNDIQQVYGEVSTDEMESPDAVAKFQEAALLPGDITLNSLFTKEEYKSVATSLKTLMGVDLKVFDKIKPTFINAQLSMYLAMKNLKDFDPQQQLDTWFQKEAKRQGKLIGALETIDYQLKVLYGSYTLERQAHLLYCSIKHLDYMELQTKEMSAAYMNQDLDRLLEIMEEKTNDSCDSLPEEEDALIYKRNANWAKQMPSLMKERPTMFVVGSGHLPGDRGVLNLLKKQGYTVEGIK